MAALGCDRFDSAPSQLIESVGHPKPEARNPIPERCAAPRHFAVGDAVGDTGAWSDRGDSTSRAAQPGAATTAAAVAGYDPPLPPPAGPAGAATLAQAVPSSASPPLPHSATELMGSVVSSIMRATSGPPAGLFRSMLFRDQSERSQTLEQRRARASSVPRQARLRRLLAFSAARLAPRTVAWGEFEPSEREIRAIQTVGVLFRHYKVDNWYWEVRTSSLQPTLPHAKSALGLLQGARRRRGSTEGPLYSLAPAGAMDAQEIHARCWPWPG